MNTYDKEHSKTIIKIEKVRENKYRILVRPTEVYEIGFKMPNGKSGMEDMAKVIVENLTSIILKRMKKDYCEAIVVSVMDYYKNEQKGIMKRIRK